MDTHVTLLFSICLLGHDGDPLGHDGECGEGRTPNGEQPPRVSSTTTSVWPTHQAGQDVVGDGLGGVANPEGDDVGVRVLLEVRVAPATDLGEQVAGGDGG